MKRLGLAALLVVVLGAPAGAGGLTVTITPSNQVYPKRDGFKDSVFIEATYSTCSALQRFTIRNSAGQRVWRITWTPDADKCLTGGGHIWYGREGRWSYTPRLPYGTYTLKVRVDLRNGGTLATTRTLEVLPG